MPSPVLPVHRAFEDPHIAVAIRLAIAGRCLPILVDDDVCRLPTDCEPLGESGLQDAPTMG